jgi:hypothetical protein
MKRDPNRCCVCDHPILNSSRIPRYFCKEDWQLYKPEVLAKTPWTKYLIQEEKKRRERRQKVQKLKIVEVPWRKDGGY